MPELLRAWARFMGPVQMLLSCIPCVLKHLVQVSVRGVADSSVFALVFQPLFYACCVFIQASNIVDFVILTAIEVLGLCGHNYFPVEVSGFTQIGIKYLFVNIRFFDKIPTVD